MLKVTAFAVLGFAALAGGLTTVSTPALAGPAPAACYGYFPGPAGKKCCDKSYARVPQGAMRNSERWTELEACTGKSPHRPRNR